MPETMNLEAIHHYGHKGIHQAVAQLSSCTFVSFVVFFFWLALSPRPTWPGAVRGFREWTKHPGGYSAIPALETV